MAQFLDEISEEIKIEAIEDLINKMTGANIFKDIVASNSRVFYNFHGEVQVSVNPKDNLSPEDVLGLGKDTLINIYIFDERVITKQGYVDGWGQEISTLYRKGGAKNSTHEEEAGLVIFTEPAYYIKMNTLNIVSTSITREIKKRINESIDSFPELVNNLEVSHMFVNNDITDFSRTKNCLKLTIKDV